MTRFPRRSWSKEGERGRELVEEIREDGIRRHPRRYRDVPYGIFIFRGTVPCGHDRG